MPKYKIMFSKTGMARFISHLDLLRIFERAFRRADLPMAFSQGFNPHPKMSIAAPLAVGIEGKQELLEIELTGKMEENEITRRLNSSLPAGVEVLGVKQAQGTKPLMAMVKRAVYSFECMPGKEIKQQQVEQAVSSLLNEDYIIVKRSVKGRVKEVDIRPGILSLEGKLTNGEIIIKAEVKSGSEGNVRPEEIKAELEKAGIPLGAGCKIYRLGLYGDEKGKRIDLW
ncbi:MAG: DUF2344 domain-containing protein [Desulfotomaculum sp.]|nr:DUF2344 domain-containing protein [Desulfotomaculum sp.]